MMINRTNTLLAAVRGNGLIGGRRSAVAHQTRVSA